ncbi:MAG: hypothetical protein ACPG5T_04235, partial [Endozoicomonas sp.]
MQLIPMLSNDQITQAIGQVDRLFDLWEQRHFELPFFTLGAASYLDSSKISNVRYYRKAARLNPFLKSEFDWLYSRLIDTLEQATGYACALADGQALPGFHIFKSHRQFLEPVASRHIDLQYQGLEWENPESIDFEHQTLSFTLALELPTSGAGLNTWPQDKEAWNQIPVLSDRLPWHGNNENGQYVAYQPGYLAVHSGNLLHQIAPIKTFQPDDRRITLQGHGVLKNSSQ